MNSLSALDHAHVWHPFTPMRQWREQDPLIIERGEGPYLFDTQGKRYIDGTSSLWCNVHGHRHPYLDQALRDQLDKVAHTTMLGLSSPPAITLAARLCACVNQHLEQAHAQSGREQSDRPTSHRPLTQAFFTDAGATAVEVALKMAIGYWQHTGHSKKRRVLRLGGSYHGDTVGSMSVGYSDLFHRPYRSLLFEVGTLPDVSYTDPPGAQAHQGDDRSRCDSCHGDAQTCRHTWPSECARLGERIIRYVESELEVAADQQRGVEDVAAVIIEPVMQGAAGMMCQPPGFVRMVRDWCDTHDILLIVDEVATGFGRTGKLFACEHDAIGPDILCLAKGLTAGYLPLAATLATDRVAQAFEGSHHPDAPDFHRHRTLYHGHTYTGNPLAAAVANASLDLWEMTDHAWQSSSAGASESRPPLDLESPGSGTLLDHIAASAELVTHKLNALRGHPRIRDVRQRGLMVGIELAPASCEHAPPETVEQGRATAPAPPASGEAAAICHRLRERGVILRPLGDVLVLMPIPATSHDVLEQLLDAVIAELHMVT